MLTIKQPVHYGYKSIHDLPTPPNTSRHSPPLMYQESLQKPLPGIHRSHSPPSQLMSGSHRGLPPPAAMGLGQTLPTGAASHPPPPGPGVGVGQGHHPPPPPSSQSQQQQQQQQQSLPQYLGQLPPPPGWQGSEDSMRAWLQAKAEEEKRRQEEERTQQERLRLDQRRTEYDILRASLQGGIPPPMVPVVFAGMGSSNLPPAALEWAQQFMYSQAQQAPSQQQQQLLAGPGSPEHRRDSQPQAYGHYTASGGVPSTPGSAQGVQGAQGAHGSFVGAYPGSPSRARGYSMPSSSNRPPPGGSGLSSLNTSMLPSSGGTAAAQPHPGIASAQQQESQQSPSIYFHMWQPPTSQASQSGSNQPATPSVGESPRKRKATGPQQAAPPPSMQQRFRSPPFSHSTGSTISNPPPGRRRGHSRQRSDVSSYRQPARGRAETIGSTRGSPMPTTIPSSARETGGGPGEHSSYSQPQPSLLRSTAHSVSSLLSSDDPSQAGPYQHAQVADTRGQQSRQDSRQDSPHSSEGQSRVGGAGPAAWRERDNE